MLTRLAAQEESHAPDQGVQAFPTNASPRIGTNLISFTSVFPLVKADLMIATNGLDCLVVVTPKLRCYVYVDNHTTNLMGCMALAPSNLLRVALFDMGGHEVRKTRYGRMFGLPVADEQINHWRLDFARRHYHTYSWSGTGHSWATPVYPSGDQSHELPPMCICSFNVRDVFFIRSPGDYVLHVQMRLVQIAKDSSGNIHYPQTWLHEVVRTVHISAENLKK